MKWSILQLCIFVTVYKLCVQYTIFNHKLMGKLDLSTESNLAPKGFDCRPKGGLITQRWSNVEPEGQQPIPRAKLFALFIVFAS